jgi:hypothetical protein
MSKLMIVLGILAAAIGVAVAVLGFFAAGQMQVLGLTAEVAAIFIIGGILAVGLGATLGAVDDQRRVLRDLVDTLAMRGDRAPERERFSRPTPPPVEVQPAAAISPLVKPESPPVPQPEIATEPKTPIFAGAVRTIEAARERAGLRAAESKAAAEQTISEARSGARDTIVALEKAKADLASALGATPVPTPAPTPEPTPAPPEPEVLVVETVIETEAVEDLPDEGEGGEEQLFVMEEKLIRGRPARVLSDGTVEAETDEGWMRFENLEHLEEYLDAMSPSKS